jgi:hypothetical protein
MTSVYLSDYNNSYFLIAGSTQKKVVYLPAVSTCLTKVITIKESSSNPFNTLSIATTGYDIIEWPEISSITLSSFQSITLQAFTSTLWTTLTYYTNPPYISSVGTTTVVNVSSSNSLAFVDLRTQSKLLQLPNTFSTIGATYFLTVKDLYGSASTNALYLSTPSSMFFEASSMYSTIKLTSSFTSIDLLASSNTYSILNRYP